MIFEIVKLTNFPNFGIWKINKLIEFYPIWKTKIWLQKLANFRIVRPFDIPHYSEFREFSHFPVDINQFRRYKFLIFIPHFSDSRKFGRFTFKSSSILKFESPAILKIFCLKFQPSFNFYWNSYFGNFCQRSFFILKLEVQNLKRN